VIIDAITNKVLVDKGIYLGVTTNNQAEYLALKYALEECQKMGAHSVDAYMDSLLVVNQIRGTFKIRNRDLWPIHDSVKELIGKFDKFTLQHVPREMNKLADAAVNRAMDEAITQQ
jgi:ribonuclease HI